ncbi:MAG: hypothetical protein NC340_08695, partial [Ruminococcus flavefaciens]|nr:hypothetical protein [Ruminococcus flavefaciens]
MKITIRDKQYQKANPSVKQSLDSGYNKLRERAEIYEKQGIPFELVFGDDILKHDILKNKLGTYYYTYKCSVKKLQLRVLYTIEGDELI